MEKCNLRVITHIRTVKAHVVIIVKLDVVNTFNKIRQRVNINSVPTTTLKVDNCAFELNADIHFASCKTAGVTYYSVVSYNNKWVR